MAESTGLEPVHRFHDDGLAIRCITTLPTLHYFSILLIFFRLVNPFFSFGLKNLIFILPDVILYQNNGSLHKNK